MTLQQLRNYVKGRYNTDLTDTEIDDHINEVYMDLSRLFTPDTTEEDATLETVEDQAEYTVGADCRKIKEVHYDTGANRKQLIGMSPDAIIYPRTSGAPVRWYPHGMTVSTNDVRQEFGIDPPPSSAYESKTLTVLFEPEPETLDENTDNVKYIPEQYQHLIAYGVLSICAGHKKDYNVAQHWEARYLRGYNELAQKLGVLAESNFPEIAKQVG